MQKLIKMLAVLAVGQSLLIGCSTNESTDQVGPYINLTNYEFYTTLGTPVDFSNISGYDDVDGMVQVYVIDDANYDVPGTYYPVLTAKDMTGNVTEVPVTVIVEEVTYVEQTTVDTITKQPDRNVGCEAVNAFDPNISCDAVTDPEIENYITLYAEESSKVRCEKEALKINGSCEVIYTNDGSFWGYGLSDKSNKEDLDEEKESD